MGLISALFGSYSKRELKRIEPIKDQVLALEEKYKAMSEKELKAQTAVLKGRLADGETLDDILPDAFAVCREASDRVLNMRHFPVQIIGGIVLHQGTDCRDAHRGRKNPCRHICPAYLKRARPVKGVHIVTVNDYLAPPRLGVDGQGLPLSSGWTVGLIVHGHGQ